MVARIEVQSKTSGLRARFANEAAHHRRFPADFYSEVALGILL